MQAVQRIEREKRMDGGKKEEADDPHTSAAKRKRRVVFLHLEYSYSQRIVVCLGCQWRAIRLPVIE